VIKSPRKKKRNISKPVVQFDVHFVDGESDADEENGSKPKKTDESEKKKPLIEEIETNPPTP